MTAAVAAGAKSMGRPERRLVVAGLLLAVSALAVFPGVAAAHGPIAPVASSYLARIGGTPAGIDAKVLDGDQRMWLSVPATKTIVVLDYRGAPYLRFSPSGVQVNANSSMYYLNETPAQIPPVTLSRTTPPKWQAVTGAHDYAWHDGRLHALAAVALSPGSAYVGRWSVPLVINAHLTAISGGLWHANDPSLAWFWPIIVMFVCVLAGWRLRRPALDILLARGLTIAALSGIAVGGIGRELYGRPSVGAFELIVVVLIAAFVAWGLTRALLPRPGYFSLFVIAFAALWVGGVLIPTLLHGFVLTALPAFVTRAATVVCLGSGAGLLLLVFRLGDYADREEQAMDDAPGSEHEGIGVSESLA